MNNVDLQYMQYRLNQAEALRRAEAHRQATEARARQEQAIIAPISSAPTHRQASA